MTAIARLDVCVCTFRRPYLAETLKSLAALEVDGLTVRIVIADNDDTPSAAALVDALRPALPFAVHYVHGPARNISVARNACLDAADAEFIAFVDDDETVTPTWLLALYAEALRTGADAVLGPVEAVYDPSTPDWMRRGDFHSTLPVIVKGEILTGYTCNVLIRRSELSRPLRFDIGLGTSGGEDTDYFTRLYERGGRLVFAPDALVREPVPAGRASFGWLLQRRLRAGQTHGAQARRGRPAQAARTGALALAKIAYCLTITALTLPSPVAWRRNLLRATLHLGVLGGLAGTRQAAIYGGRDPNNNHLDHARAEASDA
ncbi:MAG: glycosyltransferase family 2 protein [Hyphomicrobiales bacterium]|nr:MAG: glycosyltransferase family 2 protein [Hyphomicrobiales bacterium]